MRNPVPQKRRNKHLAMLSTTNHDSCTGTLSLVFLTISFSAVQQHKNSQRHHTLILTSTSHWQCQNSHMFTSEPFKHVQNNKASADRALADKTGFENHRPLWNTDCGTMVHHPHQTRAATGHSDNLFTAIVSIRSSTQRSVHRWDVLSSTNPQHNNSGAGRNRCSSSFHRTSH